MKRIDWYILKKFLSTFFFSIFLFTVIAVVIDISEKTDNFVKSGWSIGKIIVDYYAAFVPHIAALLFPLFVFIAVIFFTSKMAGRSEIVAILAAGVSFRRVLRPYLVGGVFLAGMLWYANLYVIPHAEGKRTYFEDKYVNGNSTYNSLTVTSSNIYFRLDSFTYAGIHYYDTLNKNGGPFFMNRVSGNKQVYNMRAENIRWDTATKKWRLTNVVERHIAGLKENVKYDQMRLVSFPFKPLDLSRDEYAKDKMTTPELVQFIRLEEMRGSEGLSSLKVERYRRDATPVSVIILTIIGAIIASRKVRGGSGAHLAIGFILAALFILMDRFSTIFSTKGSFPPLIAAWLPNLVFCGVAWWLFRRAPK